MGLFSRKRSLAECFPSERLSFLPIGLGAAVVSCTRKSGLDQEAVWGSRFIGGYLLGYPSYLDEVDERLGGAMRKMLFDSTFGAERGRELSQAATGHFLLYDDQTRRGWGAGVPDGERYFKALDDKCDAQGSFDSLIAMFEIGSIDTDQQMS